MATPARSARMQAFVDLMDRPVILAAQEPESFQRIIRYESELRDWFRIYPGWQIERTREVVRLVRLPSRPLEGRALVGLKEPLDYLLFTLVLYFAESFAARSGGGAVVGDRFLLSLLAEELVTLVRNRYKEGLLDFGDPSHRRSLVRVMRLLEDLGALTALDGSAGEWSDRSASADGLFAFTEVAYQLSAEPTANPQGRDDPELRAWRALLLGPVLLEADDPAAYAIVAQKHSFVSRELADLFDWRLDVRPGMARVLREGHAQNAGFVLISARHKSEYGPALLFCNHLRELVGQSAISPDQSSGMKLPHSRFAEIIIGLRNEHRDVLAGGLGTCKAQELIDRTLGLMRENGMVRGPDPLGDLYFTPLCALYRGVLPTDADTGDSKEATTHEQLKLFA